MKSSPHAPPENAQAMGICQCCIDLGPLNCRSPMASPRPSHHILMDVNGTASLVVEQTRLLPGPALPAIVLAKVILKASGNCAKTIAKTSVRSD